MRCRCNDMYDSLSSMIESEKNITRAIEKIVDCNILNSIAQIKDPVLKTNLFNSLMCNLNTRLCNIRKLIDSVKCFPKIVCLDKFFDDSCCNERKINHYASIIYNPVGIDDNLVLLGKLKVRCIPYYLFYNKKAKKYFLIDTKNHILR
ncbi:MAG: hypothetical protein ACRC28_05400 [Clostridium sp.]|uniref:hypothetical protein n=1 Tax=Clostridium sp. TaxID=1506 RepID=UPI003F324C9E